MTTILLMLDLNTFGRHWMVLYKDHWRTVFCSSYLGVMVDASRKYLNDKTLPIQINRTFHDLLRLCISLYTIVMFKHFFRALYPVESSIDLYRESSYHSNTFSMHQLWHRERGAWIWIQDVLTKTNKKKCSRIR